MPVYSGGVSLKGFNSPEPSFAAVCGVLHCGLRLSGEYWLKTPGRQLKRKLLM